MRACLLLVAACNGASLHGSVSGRLESTGKTGAWVIDHGPCYSGDSLGFYGARVDAPGDDTGIVVKLVKDELHGWAMKVNEPDTCKRGGTDCTAVIFTKDDCKAFDIHLAIDPNRGKTKWWGGDISVDCTWETAHVWGKLVLDSCRT